MTKKMSVKTVPLPPKGRISHYKAGLPAQGSSEYKTFPVLIVAVVPIVHQWHFIVSIPKYGSGGCGGFTPPSLLISFENLIITNIILYHRSPL
jgi:hypothetical protein